MSKDNKGRSPSPMSETTIRKRNIDNMISNGNEMMDKESSSTDSFMQMQMQMQMQNEREWKLEERNLARDEQARQDRRDDINREQVRLEREEKREEIRLREDRKRDKLEGKEKRER